jgi:hypothetical protein
MVMQRQLRDRVPAKSPPAPLLGVSQSAHVPGRHAPTGAHQRDTLRQRDGVHGINHRDSKQSRLAQWSEAAEVECAGVGRGAGASPFHGWPPGVTRLLGPPCRYKHEIITLHASVQTRITPYRFCPPLTGQRHRASDESPRRLES